MPLTLVQCVECIESIRHVIRRILLHVMQPTTPTGKRAVHVSGRQGITMILGVVGKA